MKREKYKAKNRGLTLGQVQTVEEGASARNQYLFHVSLLLLGVGGMLGCFYTAFPTPVFVPVLVTLAVAFAAVVTWLFFLGRWRLPVLGALVASGLLMALLLRKKLVAGFYQTLNSVISVYMEHAEYPFQLFDLPYEAGPFACTVFASFFLFALTLVLGYLLVGRRDALLSIIVSIPFLAVAFIFNITPHLVAVGVLLSFWALLLFGGALFTPDGGKRKNRRINGGGTAHPVALAILPLFALCLSLLGVFYPSDRYQRAPIWDDLRAELIALPNDLAFWGEGGLAGSTQRADLRNAGDIHFTGKTMLQISAQQVPMAEYLKGFVGSNYADGVWSPLTEEQLVYTADGFEEPYEPPQAQLYPYLFTTYLPNTYDNGRADFDLTVKNVAENPRCVYTPYGLSGASPSLGDMDFVRDGYLRAKGRRGLKEYTLKATNLHTGYQFMTLYGRLEMCLLDTGDFENASYAMGVDPQFWLGYSGGVGTVEGYHFPELSQEHFNSEARNLATEAERYRNFVYDTYTQVPGELKDQLVHYLIENELMPGIIHSYFDLARDIADLVQSQNTYTLTPGKTPRDKDFVSYFLFENHQGYCRHFAASVALLLRAAGVPARYAEGYTVSPSDFARGQTWADIPDYRAHAWVEIYMSGIGWLPFEATPSAALDVPRNDTVPAPQPSGPEESSSSSRPEESSQVSSEAPPLSGDGAGKNDFTSFDYLLWAVGCVVILGALWLILLMFRELRIKHREQHMGQSDTNQAALAIYGYIDALAKCENSGAEGRDLLPTELFDLILKARFSRHQLTDGEVGALRLFAKGEKARLQKELPLGKRLIATYWKALL